MKSYCILGTDKRNVSLREMYKNDDKKITSFDVADVIIAPTPFSKDDIKINGEILECNDLIECMKNTDKVLYAGSISKSMKEKLEQNHVSYHDLLDLDNVAILNAIPTAEGAIATAMEITDFTLHGSNVLVMGYGKIGKILAKMLAGIGAKVYCEARKQKDIALIKSMGYNSIELEELDENLPHMDVIFNTIPQMMLDEERLQLLKKNCSVIDLSSSPGGVNFSKAKEMGINVVWALALPTKVAPVTAAMYLKETIDKLEKNNER